MALWLARSPVRVGSHTLLLGEGDAEALGKGVALASVKEAVAASRGEAVLPGALGVREALEQ